jgi:Uma2 family endonuclease
MITSKVTVKQAKVRFTYDDYLLLPEDKRYEILDGDLHMVAAPNIRHQRISLNLSAALFQHVRSRDLGLLFNAPCDVLLSEENVVQPDIFFVRKGRLGIIGEKNLSGAPDLVIEILSEGTRSKDQGVKKKIYAKYGVPEYWIVDPVSAKVEVLQWSELGCVTCGIYGREDCLSTFLLPELKLPLSEVFPA